MKKHKVLIILLSALLMLGCSQTSQADATNAGSDNQEQKNPTKKKKKTEMTKVLLKTSMGDIVIALYDETSLHKENFIKLVNDKYYDGVLFHRIIQNFMIQTGDPESKTAKPGQMLGNGGPGYTIPAEFIPDVDWFGDFSQLTLSDENSEKLELLWQHHVERHASEFQNPALVRHFEEEYEKMGIGERARKRIKGVEKLDYFFGENGVDFHDAVVTKFEYDRDKRELKVLVDTYCATWSSDGKTVYLIPFCFKDVYDFKMDVEPGNDYIWGAKIYTSGNGICAYFESAHIEVSSSELEIGEIVEQKVK